MPNGRRRTAGKRETNKREPGTGNREPKLLTEFRFPVPGGCASGAPPPVPSIPDSLFPIPYWVPAWPPDRVVVANTRAAPRSTFPRTERSRARRTIA